MLHELFVQFAFSLNGILMWSTVVTCSLYIMQPIPSLCQPQYDIRREGEMTFQRGLEE